MFHTDDGLALHRRDWPQAAPRGTVLIVHGLGEHVGRYAHVASHLNANGWRVVGYDQRGHGASEGERGRLRRGDDLLRDLAAVIDALRAESDATAPFVLLGHSLGGAVAARFVAGGLDTPRPVWWRSVDALVLSSPVLGTDMTLVQKAKLKMLETIAPDLAVGNGLKPEWVSRDAAVVAAYRADPLVHDRITARLARFVVDTGAIVQERAPRGTTPTLLLYAGSDRCVASAGSTAFASAAPAGVVTSRVFGPLFHEIFNEPERAEVFSVLDAWLDTLAVLLPRSPR